MCKWTSSLKKIILIQYLQIFSFCIYPKYRCSSNRDARSLALFFLVQEELTSNTEKKFDEAVFCGLVQGHSGIQSFFVFVSVSEIVHELITGTRVQFSAFDGLMGFFQLLLTTSNKLKAKKA
jgi:hypothetical protein